MALTLKSNPTPIAFQGRRGAAITDPLLGWGFNGADTQPYLTDPWRGNWSTRWTNTKMTAIAAQGFDHIRLALEPGVFLDALNASDQTRFNYCWVQVDAAIDMALANGLKVVVDIHHGVFLGTAWRWGTGNILAASNGAQWLLNLSLVQNCCSRLASRSPTDVALELFNEPYTGDVGAGLNWYGDLAITLVSTARAALPNHTLIIGGKGFNSSDELALMTPSNFGANVLYVFHAYYEWPFWTQQSNSGDYLSRMKWPVDASLQATDIATMTANVNASALGSGAKTAQIAASTTDINNWYSTNGKLSYIQGKMDNAANWANTNGLSPDCIWVGEFGIQGDTVSYTAADQTTQANWLHDIVGEATKRNFRWCHWTIDSSSINLTDGAKTNDGVTTGVFGTFIPQLMNAIRPPKVSLTHG